MTTQAIPENIKTCVECGRKTDVNKYASSYCSECKLPFCCALTSTCFSNFHQKVECRGSCITITNPQWVINLVTSKEKEEKDVLA